MIFNIPPACGSMAKIPSPGGGGTPHFKFKIGLFWKKL